MPQFEPANFLPQMVWLVVAFAILYFVIVQSTLPRLARVIDQRKAKVDSDLAAARNAKDEADALAEQIKAELQRNREAALARIGEAKAEAANSSESRLAAAEAEATGKTDAAEARIAKACEDARSELRKVASESAQAIVTRLTGKQPSESAVTKAVDAAMAR